MDDHHNRAAPVTRRGVLRGALAVAGGLVASASPLSSAGVALADVGHGRVRLAMPAPTGPHDVGTVSLRLVDRARQDPWLTDPHPRELMVSLWYPARCTGRSAPWMTSGALAHYRPVLTAFLNAPTGPDGPPPPVPAADAPPVSLDGVDFPVTHARLAAPADRHAGPYPVVLYSPGFAFGREHGTFVAEELASHGYVVVTVSHTYEAEAVEFPDGRVELRRHDLDMLPHLAMRIRRDDIRFVLDALLDLNSGRRPSPPGLRGGLDLGRVGMVGHSLGGATSAQAMAHDQRIRAGVNLDGSFIPDSPLDAGPEVVGRELVALANRVGDRPFMVMASGGFGPDYFGDLTSTVWHNLPGWRRFLSVTGSTHFTYTDLLPLLTGLVAGGVIPAAPQVGVGLDPARAVATVRDYLRAFFDRSLRGRPGHLLDGPSGQYPETRFYP